MQVHDVGLVVSPVVHRCLGDFASGAVTVERLPRLGSDDGPEPGGRTVDLVTRLSRTPQRPRHPRPPHKGPMPNIVETADAGYRPLGDEARGASKWAVLPGGGEVSGQLPQLDSQPSVTAVASPRRVPPGGFHDGDRSKGQVDDP